MVNCEIKTNSLVIDVQRKERNWHLTYICRDGTYQEAACDYLVNAAGFRTGMIDDLLKIKRSSMVEFKAAYLTHWVACDTQFWPEIIFHGKRGSPEGMAQFTPFRNNYFLLHGMTNDITLFDGGLVANTLESAQPKLPPYLMQKIDSGWCEHEIKERAEKAVKHLSYFIPRFSSAVPCGEPLFGAQQIPGINPEFRTANVSFGKGEYSTYTRCEVVKASSILTVYNLLIANMQQQGLIDQFSFKRHDDFSTLNRLSEEEIAQKAQDLAKKRKNPLAISRRAYPKLSINRETKKIEQRELAESKDH